MARIGEGERMRLGHTRAMVRASLSGELNDAPTREDPVFGVQVPISVPGVPSAVLDPRGTRRDPAQYDAQAAKRAKMFQEDFITYAVQVDGTVRNAGPKA